MSAMGICKSPDSILKLETTDVETKVEDSEFNTASDIDLQIIKSETDLALPLDSYLDVYDQFSFWDDDNNHFFNDAFFDVPYEPGNTDLKVPIL
jgi:hypothetical protein